MRGCKYILVDTNTDQVVGEASSASRLMTALDYALNNNSTMIGREPVITVFKACPQATCRIKGRRLHCRR